MKSIFVNNCLLQGILVLTICRVRIINVYMLIWLGNRYSYSFMLW